MTTDYKAIFNSTPLVLIAALPSNDLALANAALEGGADAIKVHCNVWHRASGHTFGSFAENRNFLRSLIALCGDVPVGLVPGTRECFISEDECRELEDMGLAFFSAYAQNTPCYMLGSKLQAMVALGEDFTPGILEAVDRSSIDVLEASIQPGTVYGQALNCLDVLRYSQLAHSVRQPVVVPTQKFIRPQELTCLRDAGCRGIMIGAVVYGQEPAPEEVYRITAAYAEEIRCM